MESIELYQQEKPLLRKGQDTMQLSKTRLSEIESLPEDAIDTSEIPELDDEFWENADQILPKISFKLNLRF